VGRDKAGPTYWSNSIGSAGTRGSFLGVGSDSASYVKLSVDILAARWDQRLIAVRCPSHLIHDMLRDVLHMEQADFVQLHPNFAEVRGLRHVLNFMTSVVEMSTLRELYGRLRPIQPLSQTRWAQIKKTASQVLKNWDAIVEASAVVLETERASQTAVMVALLSPTLRTELNIVYEFSRKMLVQIEWFESQEPRAHEVYSRLSTVTASLQPLMRTDEINILLQNGHCPPEDQAAMTVLVRAVSHAARANWESKVRDNQADETLEFYRTLQLFHPQLKAIVPINDADFLQFCRPISDSIELWNDDDGPHPILSELRAYREGPAVAAVMPPLEVWRFWCAQRAITPWLGRVALVLLAVPIGNADSERSFRKTKAVGLDKVRGAKMSIERKGQQNFVYVNAPLRLTPLSSRGPLPRRATPAAPDAQRAAAPLPPIAAPAVGAAEPHQLPLVPADPMELDQ